MAAVPMREQVTDQDLTCRYNGGEFITFVFFLIPIFLHCN